MELFFFENRSGQEVTLTQEEARHAVRVLRKKRGDTLWGVDGEGAFFEARITDLGRDLVKAEILREELDFGEHAHEVVLGISVLGKESRFEWMIEKAVELGVTRIIPFQSKRSVKYRIRPDRVRRIMISAIKQCMRSRLPVLEDVTNISELVQREDFKAKFIARADAEKHILSSRESFVSPGPVLILIGPEGDFTDEEYDLAISNDCMAINLGSQRLRAETAAIFSLSVVKAFWGY